MFYLAFAIEIAFRNVATKNPLNVFGAFLYLIIAVQLALMYFQLLTRGFEMLILRLGIPFTCIGLLNANQV